MSLGAPGSYISIYIVFGKSVERFTGQGRYHQSMATVRVTEAELARDVQAILTKVKGGIEVVVERDHRPVAVIKPSTVTGRMISEVLSDLQARGSTAVMDDDFARDIEEGIKAQRSPWNPPSWE